MQRKNRYEFVANAKQFYDRYDLKLLLYVAERRQSEKYYVNLLLLFIKFACKASNDLRARNNFDLFISTTYIYQIQLKRWRDCDFLTELRVFYVYITFLSRMY